MWNKKYDYCQSCSSTLFSHYALGFCERCYPIENKKKKLKKELELMTIEDLIKYKVPLLSTKLSILNEKDKIINAFVAKEDFKLQYLKSYGNFERGNTIDYLKFENVFNLLSKRINNKELFNHGLDNLYSNLNEKQRRILLLEILKLLDKVI